MRKTKQKTLDDYPEEGDPVPGTDGNFEMGGERIKKLDQRAPTDNFESTSSSNTKQVSLDAYADPSDEALVPYESSRAVEKGGPLVEAGPNDVIEPEYVEYIAPGEEPEPTRERKFVGFADLSTREFEPDPHEQEFQSDPTDANQVRGTSIREKISRNLASRKASKIRQEEILDGPFYVYFYMEKRGVYELVPNATNEAGFATRAEAEEYAKKYLGVGHPKYNVKYKIFSRTQVIGYQAKLDAQQKRVQTRRQSISGIKGNIIGNITARSPRNNQVNPRFSARQPPGMQQGYGQPPITNVVVGGGGGYPQQGPVVAQQQRGPFRPGSIPHNFFENAYDHASQFGATAQQMRGPSSRSPNQIRRDHILEPHMVQYRPTGNMVRANAMKPRMISAPHSQLRTPEQPRARIGAPKPPRVRLNIPETPRANIRSGPVFYRPPIYGERRQPAPTKPKKKTKKKSKKKR